VSRRSERFSELTGFYFFLYYQSVTTQAKNVPLPVFTPISLTHWDKKETTFYRYFTVVVTGFYRQSKTNYLILSGLSLFVSFFKKSY